MLHPKPSCSFLKGGRSIDLRCAGNIHGMANSRNSTTIFNEIMILASARHRSILAITLIERNFCCSPFGEPKLKGISRDSLSYTYTWQTRNLDLPTVKQVLPTLWICWMNRQRFFLTFLEDPGIRWHSFCAFWVTLQTSLISRVAPSRPRMHWGRPQSR